MPFARHQCRVAMSLKALRDRDTMLVQISLIGRRLCLLARFLIRGQSHVTDPRLVRMIAGHQGGARRAATAAVVELREANATVSQRINVGCIDFASVITKVRKPHVIDHDQDDIRAF